MSVLTGFVDLELFVNDILTEVDTCPVPVIERKLRDCMTEACERVHIWTFAHPELPVTAGERCYELGSVSEGSMIHSILYVLNNGRPLKAIVAEDNPLLNAYNRNGQSGDYMIPQRGFIELIREPGTSSGDINDPDRRITGLNIMCSLKPDRTIQRVPKQIYDQYHNLIVCGTLARLFKMKGWKWSDPDKQFEREKEFEAEINRAKVQVDGGFARKTNKVRNRKFT